MANANYFMCTVDSATASVMVANFPANPVYLMLTDLGGSFHKTWFIASDAVKREMLAVALTAISTQCTVIALLDPNRSDPRQPAPALCYELTINVDLKLQDWPTFGL